MLIEKNALVQINGYGKPLKVNVKKRTRNFHKLHNYRWWMDAFSEVHTCTWNGEEWAVELQDDGIYYLYSTVNGHPRSPQPKGWALKKDTKPEGGYIVT